MMPRKRHARLLSAATPQPKMDRSYAGLRSQLQGERAVQPEKSSSASDLRLEGRGRPADVPTN